MTDGNTKSAFPIASEQGGGTAIRHVAESELYGVFRLMRPMVRLIGPGERRRTLKGLKRSLEAEQERVHETAA